MISAVEVKILSTTSSYLLYRQTVGLWVVLTFSHIDGSFQHLLEQSGVFLPAPGLDFAAVSLGQELQGLRPQRNTTAT